MKWTALGLSAVVCAFGTIPAIGQSQVRQCDILLAGHPEKLTVFNHYEQTATGKDRAEIEAYEPLIIVKENTFLSDKYTACMEVTAGGESFFLLKADQGRLPVSAEVQEIRRVGWVADTMNVIGKELRIERPSGGKAIIHRGSLVERLFDVHGRIYIRALSASPTYGWMDKNQMPMLRPLQAVMHSRGISDSSIETVIQAKIETSNTALREFYRLFNTQTHETMITPRWMINRLPGMIVCALVNSRTSYQQSTRYLGKDIENALLSTGARVDQSPGKVTVYLP